MNKEEYFLKCLKTDLPYHAQWTISLLTYTVYKQEITPLPYSLKYEQDKCLFYNEYKWEEIEGNYPYRGLFSPTDKIDLPPGYLLNAPDGVKDTTIGRVLQNLLLLHYPFKNKIPYINKRFMVKDIESIIGPMLKDTPPDSQIRKNDEIYVDEYITFCNAALFLTKFTQACVPSITEKAITPPPGVDELRQKLIDQYKDHLNDDTVIAKIGDELKKYDQEYLKGDESLGFMIKKSKDFDIVRNKMFLHYGRDQSFDANRKAPYISQPLCKGIDYKNIDAYINGARIGSFSRGAQTQLGGVTVKELSRSSSNCSIAIEDCGSTLGISREITNYFLGYRIIVNNRSILLTKDNIKDYLGKKLPIRSPAFCKAERTTYCSYCAGPRLSLHDTGISAAITGIGSIFLLASMKAMHGKVLATKDLDLKTLLT